VTFRGKLFIFSALVAVFVAAISIIRVNTRFNDYARSREQSELTQSPSRFDNFMQGKMSSLIAQAANISNDPRLRGVLSTGDPATIREAAEQTQLLYETDLFWVLDRTGRVIYRVERPQDAGDDISHLPLIQDVRNGYDSGDIWYVNGRLHQVSAVPVYSGRTPIGILVVGYEFEKWIDEEFSNLTELNLAFLVDGKIETNLPEERQDEIKLRLKELLDQTSMTGRALPRVPWRGRGPDNPPPDAPVVQLTLWGESYTGAVFDLRDATNNQVATGVIFRSNQPILDLRSRLQRGLIVSAAVAAVIALLMAAFLSLGLTRPINRLVKHAERLGGGDLETAIPHEAGDEIGVLARELDHMRIGLKDAREALIQNERLSTIGRMASSITHDFRQPISAIHGFMQLMAMDGVSLEQRKKYSGLVLRQIERMQGMINELLDFARGEVKLNLDSLNVDKFLTHIRENFEQEATRQGIDLICSCDFDGTILADSGRLERGIDNIVRNAIQAIDKGGRVELSTEKRGDNVVIRISDNGPGIPDEIRDSLFEPFATHGKKEGTGLGLAVTKKVVEEHGGEILVKTETGEGTMFELVLPASESGEIVL
jgi:signal transduction histidine kinase